jgi:hypothetical protein
VVVQQVVPLAAATSRKICADVHQTTCENAEKTDIPAVSLAFKVPPVGLEHAAQTAKESQAALQSGAESGAAGERHAPKDPQLAAIIEAWPALSESTKAGVVAMVRAAEARRRVESAPDIPEKSSGDHVRLG